jgi:hypothetical protein
MPQATVESLAAEPVHRHKKIYLGATKAPVLSGASLVEIDPWCVAPAQSAEKQCSRLNVIHEAGVKLSFDAQRLGLLAE